MEKAKRDANASLSLFSFELSFYALSHLVELGCHSGLLVGCVVLVEQTLTSRAVDCLNSNFIGADGIFTVTFGNSCVKLFNHGLKFGLFSTILSSEFLGLLVSLCRRFNVGHVSIATSSYKIES